MARPTDAVRLAELLCSRISHDLGGAIGTLGNALDLAASDPPIAAEAMAIAADAAIDLRRRLEWLRAAWGPVSSAMSGAELRGLATGMPGAERVSFDVARVDPDAELSPAMVRALLNLLLLAVDSLGGRGTVSVAARSDGAEVGIAGLHAAWPTDLPSCLASEDATWAALQDARSILMPLTILLVQASGLSLTLIFLDGGDALPRLRLAEA